MTLNYKLQKDVKEFSELVQNAALENGIDPEEITLAQLTKYINQFRKSSVFANPKKIRSLGGFSALMGLTFPELNQDAPQVKAEAKDAKVEAKKVVDARSFLESFDKQINRINRLKPVKKSRPTSVYDNSQLFVFISDTHFESLISKTDCTSEYGAKEEARSLASVLSQVLDSLVEQPTSKVILVFGGDIIDGVLHDPRQAAPLSIQVAAAIHLLSQFIFMLGQHVDNLEVYGLTGNHERIKSRHHDRATYQKWDSYTTMIYYAVKKAVAGLKNVTFEIPLTPYKLIETACGNIFVTHGDTVTRISNPHKTVPVEKLTNEVNKFILSLGKPIDLFVIGHLHSFTSTLLDTGTMLVVNGGLVPTNYYGQSLGFLNSQSCQVLIRMVPETAYKEIRPLKVTEADRQNEALEKLIQPFESFNES